MFESYIYIDENNEEYQDKEVSIVRRWDENVV